jgi:hypothetical protein
MAMKGAEESAADDALASARQAVGDVRSRLMQARRHLAGLDAGPEVMAQSDTLGRASLRRDAEMAIAGLEADYSSALALVEQCEVAVTAAKERRGRAALLSIGRRHTAQLRKLHTLAREITAALGVLDEIHHEAKQAAASVSGSIVELNHRFDQDAIGLAALVTGAIPAAARVHACSMLHGVPFVRDRDLVAGAERFWRGRYQDGPRGRESTE